MGKPVGNQCRCRTCRTKGDPRWADDWYAYAYPPATQEDLLCDFCRVNCNGEIL